MTPPSVSRFLLTSIYPNSSRSAQIAPPYPFDHRATEYDRISMCLLRKERLILKLPIHGTIAGASVHTIQYHCRIRKVK